MREARSAVLVILLVVTLGITAAWLGREGTSYHDTLEAIAHEIPTPYDLESE